jgi:hypothetical protein
MPTRPPPATASSHAGSARTIPSTVFSRIRRFTVNAACGANVVTFLLPFLPPRRVARSNTIVIWKSLSSPVSTSKVSVFFMHFSREQQHS